MMIRYLFGIGLCLLLACQNGKPDPQLARAFAVHQVALQMHDSLKLELTALRAQSLTPEVQQELDRLQEASIQWETGLLEVPDFDHAEGQNHNHAHHHNDELKDLPPLEILNIQEAMLEEVKRLLDETRGLAAPTVQPSS